MGEMFSAKCPDCSSPITVKFCLLGSFGNPMDNLDKGLPIEVFIIGFTLCDLCYFKTGGDKKFATVRLMYDMDFKDWCLAVASGLQVVILNKGEPP